MRSDSGACRADRSRSTRDRARVLAWSCCLRGDTQNSQSVAEKHLLDLVRIQARQAGAFEHVIQSAYTGEACIDGGERIISSKKHLVPDAVFLHEHERMIQLERAVVERRYIRIDIGMLADGHYTFAFVRMAQVRHDDANFGKACGDFV